jgi:predicted nucleic acid-binding protein
MLIESDLLIPLIKAQDRHRPVSDKVFEYIQTGRIKDVYASTAAIQEIIFWLYNRNLHSEAIQAVNAMRQLPNIEWVPLDPDTCLKATILIKEYTISPFDAYHAATALSRDATIISTDHAYNKIPGITLIDPYEL